MLCRLRITGAGLRHYAGMGSMKKFLLAAALLCAPVAASAQPIGPSFTATGYTGTPLTAAGGDVWIRAGGIGWPTVFSGTFHFFEANEDGTVKRRLLDFNTDYEVEWLADATERPPRFDDYYANVNIGNYAAGSALRFGLALSPLDLVTYTSVPNVWNPGLYDWEFPLAVGNALFYMGVYGTTDHGIDALPPQSPTRFAPPSSSSAVPEPSSMSLSALAIAALLVWRSRRRVTLPA